jgi:hypothetical protein
MRSSLGCFDYFNRAANSVFVTFSLTDAVLYRRGSKILFSKRFFAVAHGRRYATILKDEKIRLLVNGDGNEAFEYCVWHSSRRVERRGLVKYRRFFEFNEVVGVTVYSSCQAFCGLQGSVHFARSGFSSVNCPAR